MLNHHSTRVAGRSCRILWSVTIFVLLVFLGWGCGVRDEEISGDATSANDAYTAARILVGKSVVSPATTRISSLDDDLSTGAKLQADGNWKIWGWLEMTDPDGIVVPEEWRAVMRRLDGDGRRWHALWLKVGDQQSGDPTAWRKDP